MYKYILVAIVAYYAHYFYHNHTHKDVLLLLKANKEINVETLKMFYHTDSVYKVKSMGGADAANEWNYAVLAKGFLTDDARQTYVAAIRYFSYVENLQSINLYADPATVAISMNVGTYIAKFYGFLFGTLPIRPLKQHDPMFKCSAVVAAAGVPIFSFNLMKYGNETSLYEFGKWVMSQIHPVLNIQMMYSGVPEHELWQRFNIARCEDRKSFCEYMGSEIFAEKQTLFTDSFAEYNGYTAAEV